MQTETPDTTTETAGGASDVERVVSCGLCKNCKHWSGDKCGDKRTCEADFVHMGYRLVTSELPLDSVHIEDDEGWGWFTGPEFGCVHFKAANK